MSTVRTNSKSPFILITAVVFCCLLVNSCDQDDKDGITANASQFIVAIVGDGVDGARGKENTTEAIGYVPSPEANINARQGMAMWGGAEIAYKFSPNLSNARNLFVIKGYDDRGQNSQASAYL
jgi:hypothetical protein